MFAFACVLILTLGLMFVFLNAKKKTNISKWIVGVTLIGGSLGCMLDLILRHHVH